MTALREEFERFKQSLIDQGMAQTLLRVLKIWRLLVTEEARQRILSCTDTQTLDRWVERAAVATTTEEIFDAG